MKLPFALSIALLSLGSAASAQIQRDELLVTSFASTGDLDHYKQSGALVQTFAPGSPGLFTGAGLLPNGDWVTARRTPSNGLVIYDPVNALTVLNLNVAVVLPGDVEVRSDGTIVLIDQVGVALRLNQAGAVLIAWPIPGSVGAYGLFIDQNDDAWIADYGSSQIIHLNSVGGLVGAFPTVEPCYEVLVAPDGTVWASSSLGNVWHRSAAGALLGGFPAFPGGGGCFGLEMMSDGVLWVSDVNVATLRKFDQVGTPLSSFPTSPVNVNVATLRRWRIGQNYCQANPNSTSQAGLLVATGSNFVALIDFTLLALRLPPNENGYVLNSMNQGFVANPGGSAGNLCLGSGIGRHTKQVANSGPAGIIATVLNLNALPRSKGGPATVMPGETWYFQLWHRDGTTSNFTDGVGITFK